MAKAKDGDTLRVHYTGRLEDGTTFDTSRGGDPLEFTLGGGQIIPGFERGVAGMEPGEVRQITIAPEDAYGEHNPDMVVRVERSQLPDDLDPQVGEQLEMRQGEHTFVVTVIDSDDDSITLDGNHPLAGKTLNFEIELVEIVGA